MKVFGIVYGLYDPTTQELRYVGQTTKGLACRLSNHLSPSGLRKHLRVSSWLKSLLAKGLKPDARVIGEASDRATLDALEVSQIEASLSAGARLTNLAQGGRVNSGFKKSPEAIAKIVAARTGTTTSLETKKKLSEALMGRLVSPAHRAKLGHAAAGRSATKATRAVMRKASLQRGIHDEYILRRTAEGATRSVIAEETGLHHSSVRRALLRLRKSRPLRDETERHRQKRAPDE